MSHPGLEIGDIARRYGPEFRARFGPSLSPAQRRVLDALAACRTATLGGHVEACDHCGYRRIAYNACRDRHCPKCQGSSSAQWMQARADELLPVPYFHVVFTLPETIAPLALQNPRRVYGLLFAAAARTLLEVAADPRHLGARIGFLAVLHTWGQNLMHHPHLHCVVAGGGIAPDGTCWVDCRRGAKSRKPFFLPVRVLSRVFRGKFLHGLRAAYDRGELAFHGRLAPLAHPVAFASRIQAAFRTDWVVYAKRPFGSPEQVLKYLARYTHRVAISNRRILAVQDGQVTFAYKDYRDRSRSKTMTLSAVEFLRRFLLHVLPSGFVRIRHYGFLANRDRCQNLVRCRQLLGVRPTEADEYAPPSPPPLDPPTLPFDERGRRCPACAQGHMMVVDILPRLTATAPPFKPTAPATRYQPAASLDTS